jgi:hypothetical protein
MMSDVTAVIDTTDRASRNVIEADERPAGRMAPTVVHCAWPVLAESIATMKATAIR